MTTRGPYRITLAVAVVLATILVFTTYTWTLNPQYPSCQWSRPLEESASSNSSSDYQPLSPFSLEARSPIVFSLVMFGRESAEEGRETIKSILYQSSRPVDIHVVCSEDAEPVLRSHLDLVTTPRRPVRMFYHVIKEGQGLARAGRAGVGTKHGAGEGGLLKILIHEILPAEVTHSIYVDTDAIFAADPALLWAEFDYMKETDLVSLTTVGKSSKLHTICSCTMLLPLSRQREMMLVKSNLLPDVDSVDIDLSIYGRDQNGLILLPFGDQGFYYALWSHRLDLVREMSLVWDVGGCNGGRGMGVEHPDMTQAQQLSNQHHDGSRHDENGPWWETGQQLWPGIIHLNCVPFNGDVWHDPQAVGKYWGVAPEYIAFLVNYRWIHLNQFSHHARLEAAPKVQQHTYRDIKFMDERMAAVADSLG